ncbi:MAG: hypothetical protein JXR77_12610 [Lentisphaeria bacterium]|nr:hypothetical protein [Lentisphaeria bacterium]
MRDLHIRDLRVHRFLGIGVSTDAVWLAGLCGGIDLVWAENGRGKSCTAECITAMLWGNREQATGALAEALWEADGEERTLRYNAGECDGIPGLPEASVAPLYRMSLHELLAAEDKLIAARIRSELYGNLRLEDAARTLGFDDSRPTERKGAAGDLATAVARLEEVRRHQRAIRDDADRLSGLERERDQLSAKIRRKGHLELVRDLREIEGRVAEATAAMSRFDPRLSQLTPEGLTRLRQDIEEFRGIEKRIADRLDQQQEARKALARTRFAERPSPGEVWFRTVRDRLDALTSLHTALRNAATEEEESRNRHTIAAAAVARARQELAAGRETLKPWPERLALEAAENALAAAVRWEEEARRSEAELAECMAHRGVLFERIARILPEDCIRQWLDRNDMLPPAFGYVEALQEVVKAKADLRDLTEQVEAAQAEDAQCTADAEHAQTALPVLRDWLGRTVALPAAPAPGAVGPLWLALCLSTAAFLLLAWLHRPVWLLGLVSVLVAIGWHFAQRRERRPGVQPPDLPSAVQPSDWTPGSVLDHIHALSAAVIRQEQSRLRLIRLEERRKSAQGNLAGREETLENAIGAFVGAVGAGSDARVDPTQVQELRNALESLRSHTDRMTACRERRDEQTRQAEDSRNEASRHLPCNPLGQELTTAALQAWANHIRAALDRADDLQDALSRCEDDLRKQQQDLDERVRAHEHAREEQQQAVDRLRGDLQEWQDPGCAARDLGSMRALFDALTADHQTAKAARSDMQRTEQDIGEARELREAKLSAIAAELHRYGFPGEHETWDRSAAEANRLLQDYDAYIACRQESLRCELLLDSAQANRSSRGVPEDLHNWTMDQLLQELKVIHEDEKVLDLRRKEIEEIDRQVRGLRDGTALEEAEAGVRDATTRLKALRDKTIAAGVGQALLEVLQAHFESQGNRVLERAGELLQQFTRNQYTLTLVGGGNDALEAVELRTGRRKPLDELSSNRRIQALMAARMAFLVTQETDLRPPLVLDEAFAIADPRGIEAAMDVAVDLARQGRQVIYFTARPTEVREWERFLGREELTEPPRWRLHEDLGQIPEEYVEELPGEGMPLGLQIPRPETGEPYEQYGLRIRVPKVHPWQDASGLHPWYLLDDTQSLYQACQMAAGLGELQAYIRRVGQERAARSLQLPDGAAGVRRILTRGEIAETCCELWRRGRGRPVTAEIITQNRLLTENKLRHAMTLLDETGGDATLFAERILEVEGIGAGTREKLHRGLVELGCIVDSPRLDADAALRLLHQQFPDSIPDCDTVLRRLNLRWQ